MKSASRKPQPKRKYFKSRGFSRLFCFSWEQRKVQDVADRFDNLRIPVAANLRVHGTTPYYGANGIQDYVDGFTHDGEFVLVAEDGANDLKNYPVKCVNGRIWVNNHAHVLQGKARIADNSFLAFAISQSDIESLLVGGGRAKLNAETLMSIEFRLPCLQEQYRIGEYLSQLDNLITLHQRDSIMRFFGAWDNANAWEQRKFGDVVETRRGLTYKPSDICDSGIRVLRSSNIDEDTFVLKADDVFVKKDAVNIDYAKENDILITSANGSSRLVGKHAIISSISGYPAVHGGFMLLGTTKEPYFINASMGSSWYRRFIELYVAGGNGAIGNLNKNDLDNQVILIPSEPEQRAIGAFFKQLDHLITLHQRERKNRLFGGKNVKQYNFSRLVLQLLRAMDSRLQRRGSSQGDYG